MAVEVRAITDDELVDWVEVGNIAFGSSRSPIPVAEYRRSVLGPDLSRTLGAFVDGTLAGTYESFSAELTLPGGTSVVSNAVTSVSVLPTFRRRGLLRRMIDFDLRQARERAEPASILIPAEFPIYGRFGFGCAVERADYRLVRGVARFLAEAPQGTPELVQPARMREIAPTLFDRFRRLYPGQIERRGASWDSRLGLRASPWRGDDEAPRCVVWSNPSGEPEGYLLYRVVSDWHGHLPAGKVEVQDLISISDAAYVGLWRYCTEIDLVAEAAAEGRSVDEPLTWMLDNARAAFQQTSRLDFVWLRPLDLQAFFGARRYASEERIVFEVSDPMGLCGGRVALEGGPSGATCRPTSESAELELSMLALGAISLGGISPTTLAHAGLIHETRPGALARTEHLFHWPVAPWCSTFF